MTSSLVPQYARGGRQFGFRDRVWLVARALRWKNGLVNRVKFRHNIAISIAGLIATFGAVPVAATAWYLAPILLAPIAVMAWGWRAGTDADQDGVSVRALFGKRRFTWAQLAGFVPADRRVVAQLADGGSMVLPAVTPADLPRLIAASGRELTP
jgi:hypothetical protein